MGELGLLQVRLVPKSRLPVTAGSLSSYSQSLKLGKSERAGSSDMSVGPLIR